MVHLFDDVVRCYQVVYFGGLRVMILNCTIFLICVKTKYEKIYCSISWWFGTMKWWYKTAHCGSVLQWCDGYDTQLYHFSFTWRMNSSNNTVQLFYVVMQWQCSVMRWFNAVTYNGGALRWQEVMFWCYFVMWLCDDNFEDVVRRWLYMCCVNVLRKGVAGMFSKVNEGHGEVEGE